MNKIDLYLYEFENNLLIKNKKATVKELHDNIIDSLNGDESEANIDNVLNKLGNPKQLAATYLTTNKYLIGPKLFDKYVYTSIYSVKIALLILFILYIISISIAIFTIDPNLSLNTTLQFLGYIIPTIFITISVVTIVFAIMEQTDYDLNNIEINSQTWNTDMLKQAPSQQEYKLSNIIAELIIIPMSFAFMFAGIYMTISLPNGQEFNIFNQDLSSTILLLISVSIIITLANSISKLIDRKLSKRVYIIKLVDNIQSIIITYILLIQIQLFSDQTISYITNFVNNNPGTSFLLNILPFSFFIVCVISIYSIITNTYRYLKQNK